MIRRSRLLGLVTALCAVVLAAGTAATCSQPSWDKVIDQALTVWNVQFAVLKGEPPATVLSSAQDWKTFRSFVGFVKGYFAK